MAFSAGMSDTEDAGGSGLEQPLEPVSRETSLAQGDEELLPDMPGEDAQTPPSPGEEQPEEGAISDKGMEAIQPVLGEAEFSETFGAPGAEVTLPPPASTRREALFGAEALIEPGPLAGLQPGSAPGLEEIGPEKKQLVKFFVPKERMEELWERASRAKAGIDAHINNPATARQLLDQIKFARIDLMAGEENYELAERHVNEVEFHIAFSQRVARWSSTLGFGLFIYETIWAIALLLFLFLVLGPEAFTSAAAFGASGRRGEVVYLLGSMVWGGLGGVIGAWLSLIRHISRDQDFDRQHTMWYINSPIMGIGVGAVIYLTLRAGLLSITGPNQDITSPLIIYLLAWLTGYQQNVFTGIVKRMLKVFEIEERPPASPSVQEGAAGGEERQS